MVFVLKADNSLAKSLSDVLQSVNDKIGIKFYNFCTFNIVLPVD